MASLAKIDRDSFLTHLEQHFVQSNKSGPLQKSKEKAWEHFQTIGLPHHNTEVYRYVPLKNLFNKSYIPSYSSLISAEQIAPFIYPESAQSVLVFVNGHYQPSLSNTTALPKQVVVTTIEEAARTYGTLLNNQWAKALKEEKDPFAMLNAALCSCGVFLYLPPKTIIESPIQVLEVIDNQEHSMLMQPRLQVFAGTHSKASIISSFAPITGKNYCFNQAAIFAIEECAQISYTQMSCSETADAWHFEAVRATLKRDSSFKTISITNGSTTVRHDYHIALIGENSEASLNGVWLLTDKRESHVHVLMDHQAPNCRSMQLYKGVLNDFSRSSFEGKILVQREAQKTDAFQLNNNLLLSDHANADSKPNLEIFADDVKASHGATVGQLDEEQLFYMKTRGFSDDIAKNFLIYSFSKEVLDMIPLPSLLRKLSLYAKSYAHFN